MSTPTIPAPVFGAICVRCAHTFFTKMWNAPVLCPTCLVGIAKAAR